MTKEDYNNDSLNNQEFVLATFDPNTTSYINKLNSVDGIMSVSHMKDKDNIIIKLEKHLDIVDIRRSKEKIMEYDIIVKHV